MHQGRLIGIGPADELIAALPADVKAESIEDMFLAYIKIEDARLEKEQQKLDAANAGQSK
ncbi:MAG: hypothetical protein DRQ64_07065 [Gammaproteobacteria bacterium]|nr:MAG: hypothetical protein DRQ64_07065 [Gammaproteobacteria bacterium]